MPTNTMPISILRSEAEGLRIGLAAGLIDVADVVAWADRQVLADRGNDAPVLFDLSLSSHRSRGDVVSLLAEVPGEVDPRVVGRRIAGDLADRYAAGEVDVIGAARAMYRVMREGFAPDEAFESAAYMVDDGVDLALEGVYGTLDEVGREITQALEPYRLSREPIPPPAA